MDKIIKCEKKVHPIYLEWERAKEKGRPIRQLLGKYQYIYSSKKGEISLIELKYDNSWEIYSLKGNFFDDVERFQTKKQAEKRIEELLK